MDFSPPGSSVHGDSSGKNTVVVCHAFPQGIFQPRDQIQVSCIAGGFFTDWATRESQEYWSGDLSLFQGIFLTQELNWSLLCCRWILYQLSYQGSYQGRECRHSHTCIKCCSSYPSLAGNSFSFLSKCCVSFKVHAFWKNFSDHSYICGTLCLLKFHSFFFFLKNIYIFGSLDLSCSVWDLPSSLQYMGFSTLIRDRTPALGAQSLSSWTTRKAFLLKFLMNCE